MSTIRESLAKAVAAKQLTEQEKADHLAQPEVLDVYYWLVGVPKPKWFVEDIHRQAAAFTERGYTLEDLELVIRFLQRQIGRANNGERNTGGFNAASLQWRKLMGDYGGSDEMVNFNDRLTLAREALSKGWKPVLRFANSQEPIADSKADVAKLVNPEGRRPATDEERAQLAADAGRLLAELKGEL